MIHAQNVTKTYRLYADPIDRMKEALHPFKKQYHKDFYALSDVSFAIAPGEVVGVVGKNGSGKSTLLKILTNVLAPSSGSVSTIGRISSLLELGAGFNPDMTGRENVYFQGAIVGLSRRETDRHMDAILDFADIGDFIDQPVKSYSSGMFVRLAFACAVNVSPDILIVDEALAVGDAIFQRKCYAKLDAFKAAGKTILLVSHDMETIKRLCSRAILLDGGHLILDGPPGDVILRYFRMLFPEETSEAATSEEALPSDQGATNTAGLTISCAGGEKSWGAGGGLIRKIEVLGLQEGNVFGDESLLDIVAFCEWDIGHVSRLIAEHGLMPNIIVGCTVHNKANILVAAFNTFEAGTRIDPFAGCGAVVSSRLTLPPLAPGDYFFKPAIAVGSQDSNVMLRWREEPVHLVCATNRRYTFGVTHIKTEHVVSITNAQCCDADKF